MSDSGTPQSVRDVFDLTGRVAVITGGGGLLGIQHAIVLMRAGAQVVLADIDSDRTQTQIRTQLASFQGLVSVHQADITQSVQVEGLRDAVLNRHGRVDILINNAANNPQVENPQGQAWSRLEHFPLAQWQADLSVGLTGAFLCSQVLGSEMARRGAGVILNVASDLAIIAPDQRIYRRDGLPEHLQPVKPVSYSVVKTGLLGLTRYLATYWADRGVRVNAISPGGVSNQQPDTFVQRLTNLIPLGRMANLSEYQGAILFLCSDASSYMTGSNLVIDGGRSCW
jgi:NAD(P)-dependent dehydrogenase (short-subunit alcohol dehydrogenase family)